MEPSLEINVQGISRQWPFLSIKCVYVVTEVKRRKTVSHTPLLYKVWEILDAQFYFILKKLS